MTYTVRLKVKVTNPSWNKVFIDFLRNYIVPLVPFFILLAKGFRVAKECVHEALEFIAGIILLIIVIPVGLIILAVLFGIPVVLFCAFMGWIK